MSYSLKENVMKEDRFAAGHRMCAGCGSPIAIRTVLYRNGKAYVQAGAGIVADSDPEREFAETTHKAEAILGAIKEAK